MKISIAARAVLSTLFVGLSLSHSAHADVKLHGIFSSDMVLQRDKPLPVWGEADANEKVTVSIAGQSQSTQASADGSWRVVLGPLAVATEQTLTVKGNNEIALTNVAVGDVYVCGGQSNMQVSVGAANNGAAEVAASNYPNLRFFNVPGKIAGTPQNDIAQPWTWHVSTPAVIGGFSAVSYFFGREVQQKTGIPIGLINSSWPGSFAQTWMSKEALVKRDDLRQWTLQTEQSFAPNRAPIGERRLAYWKLNDIGEREGWSTPAFDDADWKSMSLPGNLERALPDFDGILWYRRAIEIPANWAGQDLVLHLGGIDDSDTTFFNGEQVGETYDWIAPRAYKIPAASVKAGRAVIAVRLLDNGGGGGVQGNDALRLEVAADATQKIDLVGDWKYRTSATLLNLPPVPSDMPDNANQPTVLFNGSIAPITKFPVRGAIWYQGESNADKPQQYQMLFPELIRDWRAQWNAKQDGEEFGFYFVQLANYMPRVDAPVESGWAELREAQTMALKVPRTGMAVILDAGDAHDIHPTNKQDVGKRLGLIVLAKEYGQKLEYSGPVFGSMKIVGKEAILTFTHADGLKTTDGTSPRTFALQGEDGIWHKADARIEKQTIVLSSADVPAPKAVRYAWANNPDVNLVNGAGLLAVSFRTDVTP